MATETDIIDCGGVYEVHPDLSETTWYVVNGRNGRVSCEFSSREEAVQTAVELNNLEA